MNREFESIGRELPYRLPPQSLEALHLRIRISTTARTEMPVIQRSGRRLYLAVSATAAAILLVAGMLFREHYGSRSDIPEQSFDQMLTTASAETLKQAAAENYDDILYNQQL